jgi:bud site selection protein 31
MPPIRSARTRKPPPEGFEDIEDVLLSYGNKMRDAENASHEGKKKYESVWPIFQISHQRSRYIYNAYYKNQTISKQLYDYLLKNSYADAALIAKWKKTGYEHLCCLRCIQTKETNFNATCICRVPKAGLAKADDGAEEEDDEEEEGEKEKAKGKGKGKGNVQFVECVSCGCRGCATGD